MLDIDPIIIPIVRAHVLGTKTVSDLLQTIISDEMQIWDNETQPLARAEAADHLAKFFSLEAAIQTMLNSPGYYEIYALNNGIKNLPDQLKSTADVQALHEAHQLLFNSISGKSLGSVYIQK